MSEILRRIACSLIIVFASMTLTHSAQSMGDENVFGESFMKSKSAKASTARTVKRKIVTRKSIARKRRATRKSRRRVVKRRTRTAVVKKRVRRKKVIRRKARPVHRKRARKLKRKVVLKKRKRAVRKRSASRKVVGRIVTGSIKKRKSVRRKKASVVRKGQTRVRGRTRFSSLIAKHASNYGVPIKLAHAVVKIESNYRPGVRGGAGEIGLMQIKPATARMMGFRGSAKALYNPDTNLKYGMKYLAGAYKRSGGTICGTVLRYNAGHGAKRMNPISARYCRKAKRILGRVN